MSSHTSVSARGSHQGQEHVYQADAEAENLMETDKRGHPKAIWIPDTNASSQDPPNGVQQSEVSIDTPPSNFSKSYASEPSLNRLTAQALSVTGAGIREHRGSGMGEWIHRL